MGTILKEYMTIVGTELPPKFATPTEQGAAIKKCSVLENTNINYGNVSYSNRDQIKINY